MIVQYMFSEIVSRENLTRAYLALVGKFVREGKSRRYLGLDQHTLFDHDLDSDVLLDQIRTELIALHPLDPAIALQIPKKHTPSEHREIFVYTIKERIKAQAIYQVVLPVFECHFSDRLFSYRPGRPPHIASYLFARRYRRRYKDEFVATIDLQQYSNCIDTTLLSTQLEGLFSDTQVLDVLKLFVCNRVYTGGKVVTLPRGIVQGVPLIALFANLYLTDIDFVYSKRVPFYIRVGDDLVCVDTDLAHLEGVVSELVNMLRERGLVVNSEKLFVGPADDTFSFLGYSFSHGHIGLDSKVVAACEREWKRLLVHKHASMSHKLRIFHRFMRQSHTYVGHRFEEMIVQKPQLDDSEQIRQLSETFFRILTEFFYGQYTPRNRRLLMHLTRSLGVVSLYEQYKKFHYERS